MVQRCLEGLLELVQELEIGRVGRLDAAKPFPKALDLALG